MRTVRAIALALAAALSAAALPHAATAFTYDPRHRWRTIETPNFRVHFHEGLEALARRAAVDCEAARARLEPALGVPDGITDVVLSDETDDANGFTSVIPYRAIHLYAVPPPSLSELNDYRDWMRTLVTHEYAHAVHMDQARGFPRLFNHVFGHLWLPNGLLPPWFIEGIATMHEGADAETGRNASALFSMYVRAQVAEHGLPQLDDVTNQPLQWPLGTSWYLYGGRLLQSVAARSGGDAALRAFVEDQAGQIWPWRSSTLAARDLGAGWEEQWRAFGAEAARDASDRLAAVRASGPTPFRVLTARGGRVENPRWSPDGTFVAYWDRGLEELPGLRRVTPDGRDLGRVLRVDANGTLALRSPREAIAAISEVYREFYTFDDLWTVDLETGKKRRLTRGERATDPDLADGGRSVVYVSERQPGRSEIRKLDVESGAIATLLRRPGDELFFPRVSPDGTRLALEIQHRGRRDVAWVELRDGAVHFVTEDDAIDAQPAWSPDGERLYFASDRGGVYDIWAHELRSGTSWRVTRAETGAFQPAPSPDGKRLAFVTYSSRGFDLAIMELPAAARAPAFEELIATPGPSSPAADPSTSPVVAASPTGGEPASAAQPSDGSELPVHDYSPWRTLRPYWWLPLLVTDGGGTAVGGFTGGTDVVGRHAWAASATWGIESEQLSYDAAYQAGWMYPLISLASRRSVGTVEGPSDQLESRWTPIAVATTFTRTRLASQQALTFGWRAYHLQALGGGVPDVQDPTVDPYENGTSSEWSVGLAHVAADRFVHSISPERGRVIQLGLRGATPDLGGDFRYASASGSWAEYLRVPGTRHVVLAVRGAGGVATGTLGGRRPFSLGGVPPPDPVSVVAGSFFGALGTSPDLLRGYADGALTGSKFALGNLELRFPLLAPEAGSGTLPAQLRRVHGAVFVDAGGTFPLRNGAPISWTDRVRFGAGAELRLEVVLAYQLRTDVRLGFAQGLGPLLAGRGPGSDPLAETQLYLAIGESF